MNLVHDLIPAVARHVRMQDDGIESPFDLLKWLVKVKHVNINSKDTEVRRRQSCGGTNRAGESSPSRRAADNAAAVR